jgi:hypothetical protein
MRIEVKPYERNIQLFIEKVAASKLVWGLKSKTGLGQFRFGDERRSWHVIPFWSERACQNQRPRRLEKLRRQKFPWPYFLEEWCVGMAENERFSRH